MLCSSLTAASSPSLLPTPDVAGQRRPERQPFDRPGERRASDPGRQPWGLGAQRKCRKNGVRQQPGQASQISAGGPASRDSSGYHHNTGQNGRGTQAPAHHPSHLALAEIAAYKGWCFAAIGKSQPCQRALGRAQEHFANADGEQPPPWLAHLDVAELTALRGHSYHVLAYRIPEVAAEARALLRTAIAGRDDPYARSRTLNLMALAGTFFQRGDELEEGVAVGDQALQGAHTLTSPRAMDRLRDLQALAIRHRDVATVEQFLQRVGAVLADG